MVLPLIIFLSLLRLYCVQCFNVDTEYPIIFNSSIGQTGETYFGLSLDMQKIDNQMIFIIGAPKESSPLYRTKQSGAIFSCQINGESNTNCREVFIDFNKISPPDHRRNWRTNDPFIRATDNMFLGGTIAVRPHKSEAAVCGHLWSHQYQYVGQDHINPTGSCFLFNLQRNDSKYIGIFPLTDIDGQYKENTYYYSHAVSGFSASFTESGDRLFLGAPGFNQWRGSWLEVSSVDLDKAVDFNFEKEKYLLHKVSHIQTESYFGYSLVSGHFLAGIQTSIASGAPRDNNYRGRVYIYNTVNGEHTEETTSMFMFFEGSKLGEYFGASLLAVNLNDDAYTDLIVGAPFYSPFGQSGDRGRVYVYLSNGNGFNKPQILIGSDLPFARFGSSLANIGDVNSDGYNDVAIGAPYEDDNSGAVYIYYGGKRGIITPYSQKISAKENLNALNLRGFGISISGNKDIDNNRYPDILIGSYLSNKAILLRTKPIAEVRAEIRLNTEQINYDDHNCALPYDTSKMTTCFRIAYCIKYEGQHIPSRQTFSIKLKLDSRRADKPRCFIYSGNSRIDTIEQTVTLNANADMTCFEEFTVYLLEKNEIEDVFSPIEFTLSYNLMPIQSGPVFCPQCPIVHKRETTTKELYFETGCGSDKKCTSNLIIEAIMLLNNKRVKSGDFISEGYDKNVTLVISVRNYGERAYLTKLLAHTKPIMNVLKQESVCKLPKSNQINDDQIEMIECDAGNPLESLSQQIITIPFDTTKLDGKLKTIEFNFELSTASELTTDSITKANLSLNIYRSASIEINGRALLSEVVYESEKNRKLDFITFSSLFQVIKHNFSAVAEVSIEILFASIGKGRPLLFRPQIEVIRGVSVNCNRTLLELPMLPIGATSDDSDYQSESIVRPKRDIINDQKSVYNADKNALILSCGNGGISCHKLLCYAGPFRHERQIAQFIVHSAINISTVESVFGKKYDTFVLKIASSAKISDQELSESVPEKNRIDTDVVNIIFKKADLSGKPIEKWIIIVSAVVGLLILIIIILVLIKIGFFRRTTKDEMENMQNNENNSGTEISDSLLDVNIKNGLSEDFSDSDNKEMNIHS